MRNFNQWMNEYGVSHQNPTNQLIHKICVPLIMFSVIGLMWSIPTPAALESVPYLNWATLFIIGCLLFYLSLNFIMALGMMILTTIICAACLVLEQQGLLISVSLAIFVLSWIAQIYGHKIEGKKPSFLQDLVFLLIGPLWVLRFFYSKLGIKV
jgi:uncharacterized membrane protein YGL010W